MSTGRIIGWTAAFTAVGLAVLGMFLFFVGLLVEFIATRAQPLPESLSPAIQIALVGLCLSALMAVVGFALVGVLLARQSRQQAPGYGDAYRFIQHFQFNQAIPVLERALESGHETPDVLMLLTTAYAYTGQLGKAQAMADRAVRLYPNDPSAYITLASGYRVQASFEEAAGALEAATELAPEQPVVWAELGFLHEMSGNIDEAHSAFERAAKMPMPSMYGVRVYYHLAEYYKQAGNAERSAECTAKMMSARSGLDAWRPLQRALNGTVYGQQLSREIDRISQAITAADAMRLE